MLVNRFAGMVGLTVTFLITSIKMSACSGEMINETFHLIIETMRKKNTTINQVLYH
jgi:hypothetical protein